MRCVDPAFALLMVFVSAALGCETSADTSLLPTGTVAVTSIYVDPSFFMGEMPCAAASGAMQTYVAHIYDVTGQQPVALPASPPVSCSAGVTFRQVVVGREYRIKIDGYDLPPAALEPIGGMASGSRTMHLKSDPEGGPVTIVAPRWTTHCADVTAEQDTRVNAATCEPFPPAVTTTGIAVDPRVGMRSAMPALACKKTVDDPMGNATEVGDIKALHVRPDDPGLPAFVDIPCSDDGLAPPAFTVGITPGQTYRFRIEGLAMAGGPVVWGSSCFATAKEGLVVDAVCDPLRSDGAMDIVIDDELLGAETCSDAKIATYDVEYPEPPKESVLGVPCGKSVRLSPLEPGKHVAYVVGRDKDANITVPKAVCTGTVEPGSVTRAACVLDPSP